MKHYKQLEQTFEKLSRVEGILAILSWDSAVMMPRKAAPERAEQLAFLQSLYHEILTAPDLSDKIARAKQEIANLDDWQKRNLRLIERAWLHATAVPEKLVVELSRAGSECEMVWRTARAANDFKSFAGPMKKVMNLVREVAAVKSEKLGLSKYDALLDQYDSGRKSAEIDAIFSDLKNFLPGFLQKVTAHQAKRTVIPVSGHFDAAKQTQLEKIVIRKIGFDFAKGRMDTSHHPFCGGSGDDIRITTRRYSDSFISSFASVLHETGHALYEGGLPAKWRSQPVGHALGMSMHESQSLFLEMQLCRSIEFCEFAAPYAGKAFPRADGQFTGQNLHRLVTKVAPGLIRVDADEVTYPAHVIMRYEIEKDLIEGRMEIDDLPEVWRKGMQEMLGVKVPSDKDGCMQDIHWTDGSFGYFPTYTLGALTAAQLFQAMKNKIPDVLGEVKKGNFRSMNKWLAENIYSAASLHTAPELVEKVTGKPLGTEAFKNHLTARYLAA